MNDLTGFLAGNAIKNENVKEVISDRFVDKDKKPLKWEFKAIDAKTDEEIRKSCTKRLQVVGKPGQYTNETDSNKYVGMLTAECVIFPDLNDAVLQDSYKVKTPDELLKVMLEAGEYNRLMTAIQNINGYDKSFDDKVEEAKN